MGVSVFISARTAATEKNNYLKKRKKTQTEKRTLKNSYEKVRTDYFKKRMPYLARLSCEK